MLLTVHAYFRGVGIPDGPETEVFLELGLELLVLEMSDVNNMQNNFRFDHQTLNQGLKGRKENFKTK